MKILHVINSLDTGGAEKLLVDSLPMYQINGAYTDILILSNIETAFYERLKQNFTGNIYFSSVRNVYSPMQILEIKKYLNRGYDIIHSHLFPVLYWVALAKYFTNSKVKIIFTEHNTNNKRLQNKVLRNIDKFIYNLYQKITAITPQVKNVLINILKLQDNKIEVIYNGINQNIYVGAKGYDKSFFFDHNSIILIQVSRFQRQKDQETLIKALTMLSDEYKLLLVGDGELKDMHEKLVKQLGLSSRVKFLGIRMDIPELLMTSDIVVQSSHWEGFGLAAVEGMAASKPVIASKVDGLREVVENYGLLFDKGNEKDLAEIIKKLSNKQFYETVAHKCSIRAQDFSILKMVKKNIELYKSVLNE